MQPTLRQTPPSVATPVDEHDLLAEIGGAKGGGIAAGPSAEHDDVAFEIGLDAAWAAGAGAGAGAGAARRGRSRLRLGRGRRRRRTFDRRQQRALAHLVADLDLDLADHACFRRRNVERRLVAFERENHIFLGDGLAGLDMNFDDRHVLEIADVGKLDVARH